MQETGRHVPPRFLRYGEETSKTCSGQMELDCCLPYGCTVTKFVFLAATAPAGLVSAGGAIAALSRDRSVRSVGRGLFCHLGADRLLRNNRLDAVDVVDHVVLNVVEEALEHPEPLGLVDHKGVLLA